MCEALGVRPDAALRLHQPAERGAVWPDAGAAQAAPALHGLLYSHRGHVQGKAATLSGMAACVDTGVLRFSLVIGGMDTGVFAI